MRRTLRLTPRPGRWLSVAVWMFMCLAALVAEARDARAGDLDETLDLAVSTRVGTRSGTSRPLRSPANSAALDDALGRAQLTGRATTVSPMVRLGMTLSGARFGLATGFTGARGLRLHHQPLSAGYAVTDGRVGGIPVEAYGGYALQAHDRLQPFVEARTTATVWVARARLSHRDDGQLGELRMHGAELEAGARAGLIIAPNDYVRIEASVGRTFYGPGAWTGTVSVGLPIPLDNL